MSEKDKTEKTQAKPRPKTGKTSSAERSKAVKKAESAPVRDREYRSVKTQPEKQEQPPKKRMIDLTWPWVLISFSAAGILLVIFILLAGVSVRKAHEEDWYINMIAGQNALMDDPEDFEEDFEEESEAEPVEETISVTIPVTFRTDYFPSGEEIDAYLNEGLLLSKEEDDYLSMTLTMAGDRHTELMERVVGRLEEDMAGMVSSGHYPNISNISANDDYSVFTVTTASEVPDLRDRFAVPLLYHLGGGYHAYLGTEAGNVHVDFMTADTGETTEGYDSQSMHDPYTLHNFRYDATDTAGLDTNPIQIVYEYVTNQEYGTEHLIVVTNTGETSAEIISESLAYSEDGSLIGVVSAKNNILDPGSTAALLEETGTDYTAARFDTVIKINDSAETSAVHDLSYEQRIEDGGAAFTVTNNGSLWVEGIIGTAVFKSGGEPVYVQSQQFRDSEAGTIDMGPSGSSEEKLFTCPYPFDEVEFYLDYGLAITH